MEYICKLLRIVTGTQKVLLTCTNGSDDDDDGIGSERSLLKQGRRVSANGLYPGNPQCPEGVKAARVGKSVKITETILEFAGI